MKIAIVHLSDFHIHAGEKFLPQKINGFDSIFAKNRTSGV